MLGVETSVLLIGVWAFLLTAWLMKPKRKTAPGPTGLPLFGNVFEFSREKSCIDTLYQYQSKYGDIFQLKMFHKKLLVLCGHKLIKEALVDNSQYFSNRPSDLFLFNKIFKNKGILFGEPHLWPVNRKFALTSLKDFGLGKASLEERVHEEIAHLCDVFDSMEGEVFNINLYLTRAFSNVICSIIFGDRFEYNDKRFQRMTGALNKIVSQLTFSALGLDLMPWLRLFPPLKKVFDTLVAADGEVDDGLQQIINDHRASFDPLNIRDFIDLHLQTENGNDDLTKRTMIKELFAAGTETTSTTTTWASILMSHHPNVQSRCRSEIKKVAGDACVQYSDRKKLPYVQATLHEILRYRTTAPLGTTHIVSEDCSFAGYELEKDTMVLTFLDSSHNDPAVWKDPEQFNPERWLDEQGHFQSSPYLIPFGVGKRTCLGEQLARMEMFIYFVTVLQRYEFKPVPNLSLESAIYVTQMAKDPRILLTKIA